MRVKYFRMFSEIIVKCSFLLNVLKEKIACGKVILETPK